MPRFFIPSPQTLTVGGTVSLEGADARHVAGSLRMRVGEHLLLCDGKGTEGDCELVSVDVDRVTLTVCSVRATAAEPTLAVTLYQGLPKSDKMEWIIQKAVELGVTNIVPVEMSRSVSRLGDKGEAKQKRWQKIADEAAGQCGRGILPTVERPLTWKQAMQNIAEENAVVFYEGGGAPLTELVKPDCRQISVLVGPEGGFAPQEIDELQAAGVACATLGKRILRCETAPLAALAILMHITGNME